MLLRNRYLRMINARRTSKKSARREDPGRGVAVDAQTGGHGSRRKRLRADCRFFVRISIRFCLLAMVVMPMACSGGGGAGLVDQRATGTVLFGSPEGSTASRDWVIHLAKVSPSTAESRLSVIRGLDGFEDAYLIERSSGLFVGLGAFDDPTSDRAQRVFERVRSFEVGGQRPFRRAFMLPPEAAEAASRDEADLRSVRARYGASALYTLQIGLYGPKDNDAQDAAAREAAEQAARSLREEGERAFYLHGPNYSMVMVGVFGPSDYDASVDPPLESRALRELRARYPHNLLNGQGIRNTLRGRDGRPVEIIQPSVLVEIPSR